MSIDSITHIEANYIQVSCKGVFDNDELLNIYGKALNVAANESLQAVLVDIRDLGGTIPTTMDRFYHGVTTVTIQHQKDSIIFIAIVGKEPLLDPERFGETVAVNRGFYGKVFTNIDEAVAWIDKKVIE